MLASAETLAQLTGVTRSGWQARRLTEMGIPFRTVGRKVLVLEDDVRRFVRGEVGQDECSEPNWSALDG